MKTSISDQTAYREFCALAATDPAVFATFRSNPVLRGVIEHVTTAQGDECMAIVLQDCPGLWQSLAKFKTSDTVGTPELDSPTTLRYIKVLSDLVKHFGSLTGFRIAEIGGGYGGQCKIIHDLFTPKDYTLIDLPEPLMLARKFLESFCVPNVRFLTMQELVKEDYDLVISNYAFSECALAVQQTYATLVISPARRGYMIVNFISGSSGIDSMTARDILALNSLMDVLAEQPLTAPANRLFLWPMP